jgi:Domain of unknown function (DUF4226)
MVEQAGTSVSAFTATQDDLAARHGALVDADAVLAAAVTDAHAVTVDAVQQLDAIEAEIESAVAQQDQFALDTPAGAREFQRFLLDKQQQILAVVNEATALADAKALDIQRLQQQYRAEAVS